MSLVTHFVQKMSAMLVDNGRQHIFSETIIGSTPRTFSNSQMQCRLFLSKNQRSSSNFFRICNFGKSQVEEFSITVTHFGLFCSILFGLVIVDPSMNNVFVYYANKKQRNHPQSQFLIFFHNTL